MRFAQFIKLHAPLPKIKGFSIRQPISRLSRGTEVFRESCFSNQRDTGRVWSNFSDGTIGVYWHHINGCTTRIYDRVPRSELNTM